MLRDICETGWVRMKDESIIVRRDREILGIFVEYIRDILVRRVG